MKNKNLFIATICFTIVVSLLYKKMTIDDQKDETIQEKVTEQVDLIKRQKTEIASMREDLRYYANRERGFKEEIEVLNVTIDSLKSEVYNLQLKSKTHEKSPIISDSKSAYYTKFLSNRYSK